VRFGGLGVRFLIDGLRSGGGFSLVEHPIEPRSLAAPMHTHEREDEYTFVLEGEVGVKRFFAELEPLITRWAARTWTPSPRSSSATA
jgi:hypothetical protein